MARHVTEALVLRRVNYGESDRVVTLFTRELGKVPAMARGARGSRRRFGSAGLEPFVAFQAQLSGSPRRELMALEGATRPVAFTGVLADLEAMTAGFRMLELVDAFWQPWQAEPALFELLLQALRRLDRGYDPAHRLWFEACLLELAGFGEPRAAALALKHGQAPAGPLWRADEAWLESRLVAHLGRPLKTSGYDRKLGAA